MWHVSWVAFRTSQINWTGQGIFLVRFLSDPVSLNVFPHIYFFRTVAIRWSSAGGRHEVSLSARQLPFEVNEAMKGDGAAPLWQCSAMSVQCRAAQCSAVRCGVVQCSSVQCSAVQCTPVQCNAIHCSAVQFIATVSMCQVLVYFLSDNRSQLTNASHPNISSGSSSCNYQQ